MGRQDRSLHAKVLSPSRQSTGEPKGSPFLDVRQPFQSPTLAETVILRVETVILSGGGAFAAVSKCPTAIPKPYPDRNCHLVETVILSGGGAFAAVVEEPVLSSPKEPAFSSRVYPLCFLLRKLFFPAFSPKIACQVPKPPSPFKQKEIEWAC
jgi:hypothetical protein